MGNNAVSSMPPAKLDSGKPRVKAIGSRVLPVHIASIVADYLSDDSSDYAKAALVGVQPINLCLSQFSLSRPNDKFSSLGFVSLKHRWAPMGYMVDKLFSITDHKSCLNFLEQANSNYCSVFVEVLTLHLSMDNFFCTYSLDDLENTVKALQNYLKMVKHVVISINSEDFCVFSFKKGMDTVNGAPQSVDPHEALLEIIDDLRSCRKENYNVPRKSEKYLAKFVISLWYHNNREIFDKNAAHIVSNKLMWVLDIGECSSFENSSHYTDFCRAAYWDGDVELLLTSKHLERFRFSENGLCFSDNPFVERIVINFKINYQAIRLPRPTTPLTDNSPRSALIELKLEGYHHTIHLTDLNSGYFPHLRHLCIIGGKITGHLDSHRVPLLTTLKLEPGHLYTPNCVQRLLHCGRPWQVVAPQNQKGWSLASYDEPITNPQDEVKEGAHQFPPSLPVIKELMLVMTTQLYAKEWHLQLKGLRAAVPHLQSLEVNHGEVTMSGAFPSLQTLSFRSSKLLSSWLVKTPLLQSLDCCELKDGQNLSLSPQWLPHLSSLKIVLFEDDPKHCPVILDDDGGSEFPGLTRVVFGKNMALTPFFDQCRVHEVLHLELSLNVVDLPDYWVKQAWHCETLTIHFDAPKFERLKSQETPVKVQLPFLPRVKTLTVTETKCRVLLDKPMPNLTVCSLPSPISLRQHLRCPSLKRIHFTEKLSESDKKRALNPATYVMMYAQPKEIIFDFDYQLHTMVWDAVLDEKQKEDEDEEKEDVLP